MGQGGDGEEIVEQKWISVKERLPEDDCKQIENMAGFGYFLVSDGMNVGIQYRMKYPNGLILWTDFDMENLCTKNITHWMPLPQPPEE
jgi:hypothetical protein